MRHLPTQPERRGRCGATILDLSCPEAARLALLNPAPIEFDEIAYTDGSIRPGNIPALAASVDPQPPFREVQLRVIALLQNRSYPVWKRLFLLGSLCEELQGDTNAPDADAVTQLEAVLELIVARIGADHNPRRFLECYQEFMSALRWTAQSTMDQIAARYAEAYSQYYVPFMSRHEYILEHYLVNYVCKTLFPYGLPESNARLRNQRVPSLIRAQYMLMAACFAIIRTLLIGMAGFHKSAFGTDQVIKLVQSCTKPSSTAPPFRGGQSRCSRATA